MGGILRRSVAFLEGGEYKRQRFLAQMSKHLLNISCGLLFSEGEGSRSDVTPEHDKRVFILWSVDTVIWQ